MTDNSLPDTVEDALAALDRAAAERATAATTYRQSSARCRALVIHLLRLGVERKDLVDRPFTGRGLTYIQAKAGLTRKDRKQQ